MCSLDLRLATAQHVIFTVICDSVWQRFFSSSLWQWKPEKKSSHLTDIYSHLEADGKDFQQKWKISTLKGLARLDTSVDVKELFNILIDRKIIPPLKPLLDDGQIDHFKDDLNDLLRLAVELGSPAERDQSPVDLDLSPTLSNRDDWMEYLTDEDETNNVPHQFETEQEVMLFDPQPLFIRPKIYRRGRPAQRHPSSHTITHRGNRHRGN